MKTTTRLELLENLIVELRNDMNSLRSRIKKEESNSKKLTCDVEKELRQVRRSVSNGGVRGYHG